MAMGPRAHIGHAHLRNPAAEGDCIEKEALDLLLLPLTTRKQRKTNLCHCCSRMAATSNQLPSLDADCFLINWHFLLALSLLFSKVTLLLFRKLQNCQDLMKEWRIECLTKDAISPLKLSS